MTSNKITYTKDEVYAASLEYFGGDSLAANVFFKYCLQDTLGVFYERNPDDMHKRLAKEFARIEARYPNSISETKIYECLKGFKKIVIQGSPSFGVGNDFQIVSLANCLTLSPVVDSYGGICNTDQELVQASKRRAGLGFSISNLRPVGSITKNAALTSTGIGPFMERFSNSIREVGQSNRRGAGLISLSIHHPEIETFITIKNDRQKATGVNLSIELTDEFMKAVQSGEKYQQRFPVELGDTHKVENWVDAKTVWGLVVENAWLHAEPCLLFWDTIKKNTPSDCYELTKTVGVNACSEINLGEFGSCILTLLNAFGFVKNKFTGKACFDFSDFSEHAKIAQRLLDDLIDLELEKLDKIIQKIESDPEEKRIKAPELYLWERVRFVTEQSRRTGLGITGLADALAACGLRYGSPASIELTEKIYRTLAVGSYSASVEMAEERGSFPIFDLKREESHVFLQSIISCLPLNLRKNYRKFGRRNIANTTTPPAGSMSCETQTASGIEPVPAVTYDRRKKVLDGDEDYDSVDDLGDKWKSYTVYHKPYQEWMKVSGNDCYEESPYFRSTISDVDAFSSIDIQAVAQKWVCHAISKTCNLPSNTSKDSVSQLMMMAWEKGCKGLSIYREGTRQSIIITNRQSENEFKYVNAPRRKDELECDIHQVSVKGEKWCIFVGLMDGKAYEVFGGLSDNIEISKEHQRGVIVKGAEFKSAPNRYDLKIDGFTIKNITKQFDNATYQILTRMVSLGLRHGAKPVFLVDQLQKDPSSDLTSFTKVLARVLKKYVSDGTKVTSDKVCQECGVEGLTYQGGCIICKNCGYSKCG